MTTSAIECVEARHGRFYVLRHDIYIGRSMIEYGQWTESEFTLMSQVLRPGDTAIDVGANIGCLTVPIAQAVGPTGCVYGFEPQPGLHRILSANTLINGLHNVRLFNAGCGAEPSVLTLDEHAFDQEWNYGAMSLDVLSGGHAGLTRRVPIVALDDVVQHQGVRLIKIDVEGAENAVLLGAKGIIERDKPALYVEAEMRAQTRDVLETLFGMGYAAYWHLGVVFEENNFKNNPNNIYPGVSCINLFCLPADSLPAVVGLTRVERPDDYPFPWRE
jgi:FkbM family methyltransferase